MTITIRSAALLALLTISSAALAATQSTAPVTARPASDAAGSRTFGPYLYDGSGNITAIGTDGYSYDAVGRIRTVASAGTQQQSFDYDAFGNLTSITNQNGVRCVGGRDCGLARAVTSTTNRLTETAGLIEYDGAGNLVRLDASYQYTYDAAGMMTATGGSAPRQFLYTADDERLATRAGTQWNWTVRDLKGAVLSEYTSQDSSSTAQWTEDYVYRGTSLLAANLPQGRRHFHLDHLGTPRLITDDAGRQLGLHKYLPFGAELDLGQPENPEDLRKFTGHERDLLGDTHELDYMHARYYTAVAGRFLSVDPTWESADVGEPQTWNRYAYVLNNPVFATDPDGREPNTMQAGTVKQFVDAVRRIESANPKLSPGQVLEKAAAYISRHADDYGNVRYIYTTQGGWIDQKHFFAAAQSAIVRGEAVTNVLGVGLEMSQVGTNSFFSYEDLPSNRAGADFGDEVFYPDGAPLSSQAEEYLNSLGATDPENAPNYNVLPQTVNGGGSSGGPAQSGQRTRDDQLPCTGQGDTPCPH